MSIEYGTEATETNRRVEPKHEVMAEQMLRMMVQGGMQGDEISCVLDALAVRLNLIFAVDKSDVETNLNSSRDYVMHVITASWGKQEALREELREKIEHSSPIQALAAKSMMSAAQAEVDRHLAAKKKVN